MNRGVIFCLFLFFGTTVGISLYLNYINAIIDNQVHLAQYIVFSRMNLANRLYFAAENPLVLIEERKL